MSSTPFLSDDTPMIISSNKHLAALMCAEIMSHLPSSMRADADIKSIKSGESVEKIRVLNYLPSAAFN